MNFEELLKHVTTRDLLKSASAAGHLPIYLYAYPAEQEENISGQIAGFASNLTKSGITLLHRDLFDVTVEVLKEDGSFDKLIEVEPKRDKYKIVKHISNVADVEKVIIPRLINEISGNSASSFSFGVWKVLPVPQSKAANWSFGTESKGFSRHPSSPVLTTVGV